MDEKSWFDEFWRQLTRTFWGGIVCGVLCWLFLGLVIVLFT